MPSKDQGTFISNNSLRLHLTQILTMRNQSTKTVISKTGFLGKLYTKSKN